MAATIILAGAGLQAAAVIAPGTGGVQRVADKGDTARQARERRIRRGVAAARVSDRSASCR